jgi:hypothetical protein
MKTNSCSVRACRGLRLFVFLLTALGSTVTRADAQVVSWVDGVRVDWSEGVIEATGVGKANFSSSIARPSRAALFDAAIKDAKERIVRCAQALWSTTPLLSERPRGANAVVSQLFVAHPPQVNLYSDGSVHAFMRVPLSRLEASSHEDSIFSSEPMVVLVPPNYKPSLGIIFCLAGETRSVPQARITIHDTYAELPTFLQTNDVTNVNATYNERFQCLKLEDTTRSREAWLQMESAPRVYIVRLSQHNAL